MSKLDIKLLIKENKKLRKVLEMVMDNRKMPHKHENLQDRLYCLAELSRVALEEPETPTSRLRAAIAESPKGIKFSKKDKEKFIKGLVKQKIKDEDL